MNENYDAVLEKLKTIFEDEEAPDVFDKQEREVLRRMMRAFEMLESWGKLGRILIWVLMTVAGAFIAWEQISVRLQ